MKHTLLTLSLVLTVLAGMAQSKEWKRAEYIADSAMVKNFTIQHYHDMDSTIKHYYHYYLDYTKLRDSLNNAHKKGLTGLTTLTSIDTGIYRQLFYFSDINVVDTIKCWFKEAQIVIYNLGYECPVGKDCFVINPGDTTMVEHWQHGYIIRKQNSTAILTLDKWVEDLTFLYADRKTVVTNHVLYYIE